jgi:hypothetical protein
MDVKEIGCGVDSSGSGYIAVEDSCERDDKGSEFLYQMNNYQHVKKHSALLWQF